MLTCWEKYEILQVCQKADHGPMAPHLERWRLQTTQQPTFTGNKKKTPFRWLATRWFILFHVLMLQYVGVPHTRWFGMENRITMDAGWRIAIFRKLPNMFHGVSIVRDTAICAPSDFIPHVAYSKQWLGLLQVSSSNCCCVGNTVYHAFHYVVFLQPDNDI